MEPLFWRNGGQDDNATIPKAIMKNQIRFVMHPEDENAFDTKILEDENVKLIDGPRWETEQPKIITTLSKMTGSQCMLWSTAEIQKLQARHVMEHNFWHCTSGNATIRFFRSEFRDPIITEGRISINTSNIEHQLPGHTATMIESRYKALRKYIKKRIPQLNRFLVQP